MTVVMMSEIHATPIIEGKFWIVEQDGEKVGTLHKKENNKFILSNHQGEMWFNKKEELTKQFGHDFFITKATLTLSVAEDNNECYGYPTRGKPHNQMYDIRRKLPLFTKSDQSKSLYCAGYYLIHFGKGWVTAFCPKAITIERYPYQGPFKTEFDVKHQLSNTKSD